MRQKSPAFADHPAPIAEVRLPKHTIGIQAERSAQGRIVSTLEGGYELHALARSVEAHLKAFLGDN